MDNQVNQIGRGQTFYGSATPDASNLGGVSLEGARKVFLNTDPTSSVTNIRKPRDQGDVKCVLVRNVSGITLAAGQAVSWKSGYRERRVDGYITTDYQEIAGFVDDHIGSGGVQNNDLFWLIVEGDVLTKTPHTGAGFGKASWSDGDVLFALTAAASTAVDGTAGKLQAWVGTFTATQTTDGTAGKFAKYAIAKAKSAMTSGQTDTAVLISVRRY